jgi:hypothetical protein
MKTLVFYFPYNQVGGVSVLFIRLIDHLRYDFNIIAVDNKGGYIDLNLRHKIKVIEPKFLKFIPNNSILITQLCPPWRIYDIAKVNPSVKLFFWGLHPSNLNQNLISHKIFSLLNKPLSLYRRIKLRKFTQLSFKKNAIALMDEVCASQMNKNLNLDFIYPYLNIFTQNPKFKKTNTINKSIKCFYLGRVEDFKTTSILHLVDRLNKVTKYKLEFTILGEGNDLSVVKEYIKKINFRHKVIYMKSVNFKLVDKHLKNFDICFAMGTSVLEAMKLGIPTLLMHYSFQKFKLLQKYEYLYELEGNSLGTPFSEIFAENFDTLPYIFDELVNSYPIHSSKAFNFWRENFSINKASKQFINLTNKSELTIYDLLVHDLCTPDFFSKLKFICDPRLKYPGWQYV